ncbi:MAG: hypothetical protein WBN40_09010 [Pseudomonadales bacterium]
MIELLQASPVFFVAVLVLLLCCALVLLWPFNATGASAPAGSGRMILGVSALLLPLSALLLYLPAGLSFGALDQYLVTQRLSAMQFASDDSSRREAYSELLDTLQRQTASLAPDAVLLELKASVLAGTGQYPAAIDSYRQLIRQRPDDAAVQAALAETLYLEAVAQGQPAFPDEAANWLEAALAIDPGQARALGLAGIRAFSESRWQDALDAWRRAAAVYPTGSAERSMIERGIAAASERLQGTHAPQAVIALSIGLDAGLNTGEFAPDTPVFVFARKLAGGGPPLAARRLTLAQLPAKILLSERDVMAQQGLAAGMQVEVIARLSISGQPLAQPGDLQSAARQVEVVASEADAQVVALIIDAPVGG